MVSCEKASIQLLPDASNEEQTGGKSGISNKPKATSLDCFALICEDSVLFPEGGGQVWSMYFN